jgi:hypothetical protein
MEVQGKGIQIRSLKILLSPARLFRRNILYSGPHNTLISVRNVLVDDYAFIKC